MLLRAHSGFKSSIVLSFSAPGATDSPFTGTWESNYGYRKPLHVCISEIFMSHKKQTQVIMSMENEECNITAIFIYNINYSIKQKKICTLHH